MSKAATVTERPRQIETADAEPDLPAIRHVPERIDRLVAAVLPPAPEAGRATGIRTEAIRFSADNGAEVEFEVTFANDGPAVSEVTEAIVYGALFGAFAPEREVARLPVPAIVPINPGASG
ncbi:MAG: hypothetical protein OER86_00595 [Phycisphaerae bacterium]|nr:hypothetical protein [Phycisphaerae bacterium]